jgi:hypothetical protein
VAFATLSKENKRSLVNKSMSTIHAIIMFYIAINYWLYENPKMIFDKNVGETTALSIDYMLGYLIYDLIYELTNSKPHLDTLVHHILGILSNSSTRISNNGGAAFYTYSYISYYYNK